MKGTKRAKSVACVIEKSVNSGIKDTKRKGIGGKRKEKDEAKEAIDIAAVSLALKVDVSKFRDLKFAYHNFRISSP